MMRNDTTIALQLCRKNTFSAIDVPGFVTCATCGVGEYGRTKHSRVSPTSAPTLSADLLTCCSRVARKARTPAHAKTGLRQPRTSFLAMTSSTWCTNTATPNMMYVEDWLLPWTNKGCRCTRANVKQQTSVHGGREKQRPADTAAASHMAQAQARAWLTDRPKAMRNCTQAERARCEK